MLKITCIPCQYGNHENCMGVIEQPPPGMMGGSECGCKGECAENAEPQEELDGVRSILEASRAR